MSKKRSSSLASRLLEIVALKKLITGSKKSKGKGLLRRRQAKDNGKKRRILTGSAVVGGLLILWRRRRARKPARALRNAQGVGPAHIEGVPRGEELVGKEGPEAPGHAAGRLVGSVHPA
ncbi:MAG TPA: hypothetical protein VKL22_06965 [Actinomycetota bacterium]|nr:hypothetical protein [Actinomycetota bacterium]